MAITSESQIIDVSTISTGCSTIRSAAEDYVKCARHIKEAAQICTADALSVEKKSMQPSLEELAAAVETIKSNIYSFTYEIESVAVQIQTKQRQELAEYQARVAEAERKAAEEAARKAANNSTSNS